MNEEVAHKKPVDLENGTRSSGNMVLQSQKIYSHPCLGVFMPLCGHHPKGIRWNLWPRERTEMWVCYSPGRHERDCHAALRAFRHVPWRKPALPPWWGHSAAPGEASPGRKWDLGKRPTWTCQWAEGTPLEAETLVPVKLHRTTVRPTSQLQPQEGAGPPPLSWAVFHLKFRYTKSKCPQELREMIHVYYFILLHLGAICHTETDNQYVDLICPSTLFF